MNSSLSLKPCLGVLAPGSNFVPYLTSDLLAALEFGLAQARLDAELVVEFAGYNADLKVMTPQLQQLLIARRVACVIAPLNIALIEKLAGHCAGQGVPLIALNLEEDPLFESARQPFVFINSFQLWQAAWMCGYLGGRRFGPRAGVLTALHEAGYGLSFAFQLGLEAAGGQLLQAAVTHQQTSTEDPSPVIASLAAQAPDFIWAAYSGKEAVSLLTAYAALGARIPLLGLAPLVSPHVRQEAGEAALGTWFVTTARAATEAPALAEALGRSANPYALLAYEAAQLIAAASRNTDGDFPAALGQAQFQGPRGLTRFDQGAEVESLFSLRQATAGAELAEDEAAPPLLREQCLLARQKLVKQGWVNPYLCA